MNNHVKRDIENETLTPEQRATQYYANTGIGKFLSVNSSGKKRSRGRHTRGCVQFSVHSWGRGL